MCQALCQPWIGQPLRSNGGDWQSRSHSTVWQAFCGGDYGQTGPWGGRGPNQPRDHCAHRASCSASELWAGSSLIQPLQGACVHFQPICWLPFQMYLFFVHSVFFLYFLFFIFIFYLKTTFSPLAFLSDALCVKFPGVVSFLFWPCTVMMGCVFEWFVIFWWWTFFSLGVPMSPGLWNYSIVQLSICFCSVSYVSHYLNWPIFTLMPLLREIIQSLKKNLLNINCKYIPVFGAVEDPKWCKTILCGCLTWNGLKGPNIHKKLGSHVRQSQWQG